MDQSVEQIVPVPSGEYELILRGVGIAELRQRITLGSEPVTKLTLTPKK